MSDYFQEMGWREGEAPNFELQMARFLRDMGIWELSQHPHNLPPRASKEAVEKLEDDKISESNKQCPVCLKFFELGSVAKTLPCKHSFHKECILPWLEKTNSCPLCRFELPTDDPDYEAYKIAKKREKEREIDIENLHNSMFS